MLYLLGRGAEGDATREAIEDVFIFVIDDMELALTPLGQAETPVEEEAPQEAIEAAAPSAAGKARRKACAWPPKGWTS
jgi:two-component system chemotaxis sensor kinase CheA